MNGTLMMRIASQSILRQNKSMLRRRFQWFQILTQEYFVQDLTIRRFWWNWCSTEWCQKNQTTQSNCIRSGFHSRYMPGRITVSAFRLCVWSWKYCIIHFHRCHESVSDSNHVPGLLQCQQWNDNQSVWYVVRVFLSRSKILRAWQDRRCDRQTSKHCSHCHY